MPRALKWTGIILGGLVLLVVGAALALETRWFRDFAAGKASAALGREVTIEDIDFRWSPPWRPVVRVEGLRIANADWAGSEPMADVGAASVRIDLPKLIGGRIVLPEVEIDRPVLRLARNDQGAANWDLGGDGADDGGTDRQAGPDTPPTVPEIGRLVIRNGDVAVRDPQTQLDVRTSVDTVPGPDGTDRLKVAGGGTFTGKEVALDVTTGSLLALASAENPFPVDGTLRVGDTTANLSGTVADPMRLADTDLTLRIEGQDLAELFPIFGFPSAQTPPFRVSGKLNRRGRVYDVDDLQGRVGDSDIAGSVHMDLSGERPLVTGDLVSKRLDLDDLAGFIGGTPGTGPGETASPEQREARRRQEAEGRLIPNSPVNLKTLNAVDVRMRLRGESIETPGFPVRGLDATVNLERGKLRLDPLSVEIAGGKLQGNVTLDGSGDVPSTDFDLNISRIQLASLFQGTRFEKEMGGSIGGRVQLATQGDNLRRMAAGADGRVTMAMGNGKVSALMVEAVGIDAAEALGFLLSRDEPVPVRCMVADLRVTEGYAVSEALVFDTTDTNVTGTAKINLGRETLDIDMLAHPKDPSPLSARTRVGIGGTFIEPAVKVGSEGLIARGAAVLGLGVLLGPLGALLPLVELGLGEDSPCGALLREAGRKAD
ncbi:AsmA family protein [Arenibaculum pallidiluteum]|uniref:AsmA family protein n=1 Tax=Arenibaculum pallidiluteum TaxID=2812559 RepID=UPI001A96CBD7|nr:AsmA family protein [Arenibaculum pallidiluteum]